MTAAVCIPWRDSGEPQRRAAFDLVRARWEHAGYPVHVGDSPAPTMNRSIARNDAASRAIADGAEVLIFCDADTAPRDLAQVHLAVAHAGAGGWAWTDIYWAMERGWWPETIYETWPVPADEEWKYRYTESPGGIRVVPAAAFEHVGGWDPAFKGWGYEDDAFGYAISSVCGPGARLVDVIHLWHPTPRASRFGQPHYKRNRKRAEQYRQAATLGTDAVRRLRGVS